MIRDQRFGLMVFGLIVVLAAANFIIFTRQAILDTGRRVLIDIQPRDPRSLIQGDYMQLRFDRRNFPQGNVTSGLPWSGVMIMELDEKGVASYLRMDDGTSLGERQLRLRFQGRARGQVKFASDTFFFQEGAADRFSRAPYAILRVDDTGRAVLEGLADMDGKTIE